MAVRIIDITRVTRKVIKKIKAGSLLTVADVQIRLSAGVDGLNGKRSKKKGVVPWDDFREREQSQLKPIPEVDWTRLGIRHRRTKDDFGTINFEGHKYLCDPSYDLKTIDVVISDDETKLLFLRPGCNDVLWEYEYFEKGKTHAPEGTRHHKMEFRMAHELTAPMRVAQAKDRVASIGPMAAKFAAAFVKAYEHKSGNMTAQKLDWIYGKLKGEDSNLAEHAFKHTIEMGWVDKDHLIGSFNLIKDYASKNAVQSTSKASTKGACLHSAASLVPPAPTIDTNSIASA